MARMRAPSSFRAWYPPSNLFSNSLIFVWACSTARDCADVFTSHRCRLCPFAASPRALQLDPKGQAEQMPVRHNGQKCSWSVAPRIMHLESGRRTCARFT